MIANSRGSLIGVKLLLKKKYIISFVSTNIIIALLGFLRSFAFMRVLDFQGLGLLTLVQTGAAFVGFSQIGLINGGYRMMALQDQRISGETNNVFFSYLFIIAILLALVFMVGVTVDVVPERFIVAIALVMGIFMMLSNWLSNTLLAKKEYSRLNKAGLVSNGLSLAAVPIAYYWGIYGGALSVLLQPVTFVLIVLATGKAEWPNRFVANFGKIKEILSFGFIPYLSGLCFLLYVQVERWTTMAYIDASALGQLYLVFIISAMWILLPTSLLNLFFPRVVLYYHQKDAHNFNRIIKIHFLTLGIYSFVGVIFTLFILEKLVGVFFPQHVAFTYLALLSLPGLVFRVLCDPISMVLNGVVKLRPLLWGEISGLVLYSVLMAALAVKSSITLVSIVICADAYFAYKFLYLLYAYRSLKKEVFI